MSYHRIAPRALDPWGMRVSPECFAEQMETIREIGDPVALEDMLREESGSRPRIAVTFDDGYIDNLTLALPALERAGIPATIFVASGYAGLAYYWWEALEEIFLRPRPLPGALRFRHDGHAQSWELGEAAFYSEERYRADLEAFVWRGAPGSRIRLYFEVYEALWAIPHAARLALVSDLLEWAALTPADYAPARPMTDAEVAEMAAHQLIAIGGHSVSHRPLDSLTAEEQAAEISGCKAHLEGLSPRQVSSFAFPHGKYDDQTLRLLGESGFAAACTTREMAVAAVASPYVLPRVVIKNWERETFKQRLSKWLAGR